MRLATLRTLTRRDWALFLQAYLALVGCQLRLRTQSFVRIQAWATQRAEGEAPVGHLRWAVNAASRRVRGSTCLSKGLALQRLLARHGHDSELKIGVAKSGDLLEAHAWLLWEGRVIMGGESANDYIPLAGWPSPGDGERLRRAAR